MSDLLEGSAAAIARRIRERAISAEEAVRAHLERIDAVNPTLNAVVRLVPERALEEARESDRARARGEGGGPLDGVPITIKDSIETAGITTTCATAGLADHVPARDAPVVARLRAAGAIVLGKTNTPELTLSGETDNALFGRTSNPHDRARTPGGSSGGAAAILAAGGSALDVGSDIGGSIREPAHFCGITGIKPTSGRVPRTGHIPYGFGALDTFAQMGPMARHVEDLALAMPLVIGPDWHDPSVVPMPLRSADAVAVPGLTIATYLDNGLVCPDDDVATVVAAAADVLSDAGATVVHAIPDGIAEAIALIPRLRTAEGGAPVRRALANAGTEVPGPALAYALGFAPAPPGDALSGLLDDLGAIRGRALAFMRDHDAIVCPAAPRTAPPHGYDAGDDRYRQWSHCSFYNVTGWPGVVVRAGTGAHGMPIVVQIVARPWREDVALALAAVVEQALGGYRPPVSGIPISPGRPGA